MTLLTKDDLALDYSWEAIDGDDPDERGVPDSSLLHRDEGYEIIDFINSFAEKYELKEKKSGLKIEQMIKFHMPSNIRSKEKIENWLKDNWGNFDPIQ